jgi:hypothetical protein
MSKKSKHNALVHGAYSSDVILPWESRRAFQLLLNGIRAQFNIAGTFQEEIAFDIAVIKWKQKRNARMEQIAFLESSIGAELEKVGERSAAGIRAALKGQRQKGEKRRRKLTDSVAEFTIAISSLADNLKDKKTLNAGKVGANVRSLIEDLAALRLLLESTAKRTDADGANIIDISATSYELEARYDALIKRKIQQLILVKEFARQYGGDSEPKLIEYASSTPSTLSRKSIGRGANDNDDNNDNDNNNDSDSDNNVGNADDNKAGHEHDWEHEFDEAQATKRVRNE